MEQTRSLFTPHPLLPHGNTCYNSLIILNSLPLLLLSELFWHKYRRPMEELCSQSTSWTSPQTTEETLRRRRTDTTHRPTYSMSRTIQATRRQKGFTCQCHCCLQVWSVCVEVTGPIDLPMTTYSREGQHMPKVMARFASQVPDLFQPLFQPSFTTLLLGYDSISILNVRISWEFWCEGLPDLD